MAVQCRANSAMLPAGRILERPQGGTIPKDCINTFASRLPREPGYEKSSVMMILSMNSNEIITKTSSFQAVNPSKILVCPGRLVDSLTTLPVFNELQKKLLYAAWMVLPPCPVYIVRHIRLATGPALEKVPKYTAPYLHRLEIWHQQHH